MTEEYERLSVDHLPYDTVMTCTDVDQLVEWYNVRQRFAVQHGELIKAHRHGMGNRADRSWLFRASEKLGYIRTTLRHIEARLLELGTTPPYPPTDPRKREIQKQERRIKQLKRELHKHGIPIPPMDEDEDGERMAA